MKSRQNPSMMTTRGGSSKGATEPMSTMLETSCKKQRMAIPMLPPSCWSISAVSLVKRFMILEKGGEGVYDQRRI